MGDFSFRRDIAKNIGIPYSYSATTANKIRLLLLLRPFIGVQRLLGYLLRITLQ